MSIWPNLQEKYKNTILFTSQPTEPIISKPHFTKKSNFLYTTTIQGSQELVLKVDSVKAEILSVQIRVGKKMHEANHLLNVIPTIPEEGGAAAAHPPSPTPTPKIQEGYFRASSPEKPSDDFVMV